MKNISKVRSIYLFNAYSDQTELPNFLSGSDKVGLKLIENESDVVLVLAPFNFKNLIKDENVLFIETENKFSNSLYISYFKRLLNSLKILYEVGKKSEGIRIISTSDFFPDVIPSFLFSWKFNWYAFSYHLYPFNRNFRDIFGRVTQVFSFILFFGTRKILTTSMEIENFLSKNFPHLAKKINKIPLGIDLNLYSSSGYKDKSLVYLGRIKKSKGIFDLPEIIFNLKKVYPNIILNVIGSGSSSDLQLLTKLINSYSLDSNIKVFSNLDDVEVIKKLNSSYILLQPSFEEGFGLAVLEGLASNLHVVAYNLPVYKEHFSSFSIKYIDKFDKEAFTKSILTLLEEGKKVEYPIEIYEPFKWSEIYKKIFSD
jgi:glycosyltransferase involved in cell wall biosynthesis